MAIGGGRNGKKNQILSGCGRCAPRNFYSCGRSKVHDADGRGGYGGIKDDSFVPIKTIPRVEEIELMKIEPDQEVLKEKERHEKLLEIPGVMISYVEVREYPLGEPVGGR